MVLLKPIVQTQSSINPIKTVRPVKIGIIRSTGDLSSSWMLLVS